MPKLSPEEIKKFAAEEKKVRFWEMVRRVAMMAVVAMLKNGRDDRRR